MFQKTKNKKQKTFKIKNVFLSVAVSFLAVFANAQAPNWAWTATGGGEESYYQGAHLIKTDNAGNSYVAGYHKDKKTVVQKFDPNGTLLWTAIVQNNSTVSSKKDDVYDLAIDNDGNSYITGTFAENSTFGTINLTTTNYAIYVAKVNATGNFEWAIKSSENGSFSAAHSLVWDKAENLYLGGRTGDNAIDFTLGNVTETKSYANYKTLFISKIKTADGSVSWIKFLTNTNQFLTTIDKMTVDNSGNIYGVGSLPRRANQAYDFDGTSLLVSRNSTSVFTFKADSNGNVAWVKIAGGDDNSSQFPYTQGQSIGLDENNNIYVLGMIDRPGNINFDSENISIDANNQNRVFIVKYTNTGTVVWVKTLPMVRYTTITVSDYTPAEKLTSMEVTKNGDIYVTGTFDGTSTTMDFGDGITATKAHFTSNSPYVVKLNNTGTTQWAKVISEDEWVSDRTFYGLSLDGSENIYISGGWKGSDAGKYYEGIPDLTGEQGILVVKLGNNGGNTNGINEFNNNILDIYPNPANNILNIKVNENTTVQIIDFLGATVATQKLNQGANSIDVSNLVKGVYFVKNENGGAVKFIKD